MCVVVYLPKNKNITNSDLRKCFRANPDSLGYMYAANGKLHIERFLTFSPFLKSFRRDLSRYGKVADFAIHFRIATSGKVDIDNCHPFRIDSRHGFVHNGIISGYGNGGCSDTNEFRTKVLQPIAKAFPAFIESPEMLELLKGYIGSYNKIVVMRDDGESWIVNSQQGNWEAGVWFSNMAWSYSYQDHSYGRNGFHGTQVYPNAEPYTLHTQSTATSQLPTIFTNLEEVDCSGCGKPTVHQDKICNDCWGAVSVPRGNPVGG